MPQVDVGTEPVEVLKTAGENIAVAVLGVGDVYFGYTSDVSVDNGFPLGIGLSFKARSNVWLVSTDEGTDVRWESVIL